MMRIVILVILVCSGCAPILDRKIFDKQCLPTVKLTVADLNCKIILVDGNPTVTPLEKFFGRHGVNGVYLTPRSHNIFIMYTMDGPLGLTASTHLCFAAELDHEYIIRINRENYGMGFIIEDNIMKKRLTDISCSLEK